MRVKPLAERDECVNKRKKQIIEQLGSAIVAHECPKKTDQCQDADRLRGGDLTQANIFGG